jgi:RHS repeat-associated protein
VSRGSAYLLSKSGKYFGEGDKLRSGANAYVITYTYDNAGSRRTMLQSGVTTTYTCDAANQLNWYQDNTGRTTMVYDSNGNQTVQTVPTGGRTTSAWDFENRTTKVVLASGTRNTMTFDGDSRRVRKDDSTGTAKYVRDEQRILLETDQNDVTQVIYSAEPAGFGNLISQRRTASNYYQFDGLGSTDRITNLSAAIQNNYIYRAFGSVAVINETVSNYFRFIGQKGGIYDLDLAWNFFSRRHEIPITGRFQTQDPLGFVDGLNQFLYVGNRPINLVDPSGLQQKKDDLLSFTRPRQQYCGGSQFFTVLKTKDFTQWPGQHIIWIQMLKVEHRVRPCRPGTSVCRELREIRCDACAIEWQALRDFDEEPVMDVQNVYPASLPLCCTSKGSHRVQVAYWIASDAGDYWQQFVNLPSAYQNVDCIGQIGPFGREIKCPTGDILGIERPPWMPKSLLILHHGSYEWNVTWDCCNCDKLTQTLTIGSAKFRLPDIPCALACLYFIFPNLLR